MTKKSVGALFDSFKDAQHAVNKLVEAGFNASDISLIVSNASNSYTEFLNVGHTERLAVRAESEDSVSASDGAGFGALVGTVTGVLAGVAAFTFPGIGAIVALGPIVGALTGGTVGAVTGAAVGGVVGAIVKTGLTEEEAARYAEGVRRGSALVIVETTDTYAMTAQNILEDNNAVDIARRTLEWETENWRGSDTTTTSTPSVRNTATLNTPSSVTSTSAFSEDGDTKRHAVIKPNGGNGTAVAARPTGSTTEQAYTTTTGEIGSDIDFSTYDLDFRKHYMNNYGNSGYAYDMYVPIYRFGYELAYDPRYKEAVWSEVEGPARHAWLSRFPEGSWDLYKDAVRYAWDQVRANR
ncbi:MAG: hypothetical protein KF716_03745 [Anaerolineae bacterium]|nr:hypothetical protein [Anaerolineae bacterium]